MRARPTIALLCLAAVPACRLFVQPTSERATRGAVTVIQEQAPEGEVGRQLARNSAIGFIDGLAQPEQLRQLRLVMGVAGAGVLEGASSPTGALDDPLACAQGSTAPTRPLLELCAARSTEETPIQGLSEQAAEVFVETFARKLIAQLGKNGQGPLADSISATGERLSSSAARGVRSELGNLFPECKGANRPGCIEQRLEALGRAASSGVARGLGESFREGDDSRADPLMQALVAAFARELVVQLGPKGEGPLGKSLAATGEKLAASTMRGLRAELAPQCQGDDARCFERRLQALGRATSTGVGEGLAASFGWLPVLLGFVAGLVAAAAVALIVSRVDSRRARPEPV